MKRGSKLQSRFFCSSITGNIKISYVYYSQIFLKLKMLYGWHKTAKSSGLLKLELFGAGGNSPKNLSSTEYYYNHIRVRELHLFQLVPIQPQGCAPEWTIFSLSCSWSKQFCSCVKFGRELSCMQRSWLGYKKGDEDSGAKQGYRKWAV